MVELLENIEFDSPDSEGTMARFYNLENGWGVKIWCCKVTRDDAFEMQEKFPQYCPKVGDKFDLGDEYGYFTEVAEPLVKGNFQKLVRSCHIGWNDQKSAWAPFVANLREVGIAVNDEHDGQFGYIDGKLVFLDSECLFQD